MFVILALLLALPAAAAAQTTTLNSAYSSPSLCATYTAPTTITLAWDPVASPQILPRSPAVVWTLSSYSVNVTVPDATGKLIGKTTTVDLGAPAFVLTTTIGEHCFRVRANGSHAPIEGTVGPPVAPTGFSIAPPGAAAASRTASAAPRKAAGKRIPAALQVGDAKLVDDDEVTITTVIGPPVVMRNGEEVTAPIEFYEGYDLLFDVTARGDGAVCVMLDVGRRCVRLETLRAWLRRQP